MDGWPEPELGKPFVLVLTQHQREIFEMWLGHSIVEGDIVLGATVVFAEDVDIVHEASVLDL